jgi:outer membrane protein OmpA-like peptidoglycan-associated protein
MTSRLIVWCILGTATSVLGAEANVSNFKPSSGADGIVATEGARPWESESVKPLDLKLLVDYGRNPVTRPGGALVEYRAGMWLSAELHLIQPLTVAVQVPFTLQERGILAMQPAANQGFSTGGGIGDIRITPRVGILRQERAWLDLALQASIDLPTSSDNLLTTWDEPSVEGLLALGHRFYVGQSDAALLVLGNVFGFTAPDRTIDGKQIGAGYGGRFGTAFETGRTNLVPARIFGEIEAKTMPRSTFSDGYTPAEWRGGASWCFGPGISFDVAAGTGITNAPGAPDWRVVSGLAYGSNSCGFAQENRLLRERRAMEAAEAERNAADEAARLAARRAAEEKAAAEEAARLAAEKAKADRLALEARDSDGDGVPDLQDNCPNVAGPADNRGCPAEQKQQVVISGSTLQILDRVHFATGKATIEKRSFGLLDQVAAVLNGHPEMAKVEVQGHTDSRGAVTTNMTLSQARADAVAKYLVGKGISPERLRARGYGPQQPVDKNETAAGREANRRVEFKVLAPDAAD